MEPTYGAGVPLTAFDRRTATAVVAVLRRAGVQAWAGDEVDGDVEVRVAPEQRDQALRELGDRMEEVREAVLAAERAAPPPPAPPPDPDDVHAGPPLVMERFRSLSWLGAVVLAPLLVVTLAPSLRGGTARSVVVGLALLAVVGVLTARWRRR